MGNSYISQKYITVNGQLEGRLDDWQIEIRQNDGFCDQFSQKLAAEYQIEDF